MNKSTKRFIFKSFILILYVFLVPFYYLQGVIMIAGNVVFDLYCGGRFDRIVVVIFFFSFLNLLQIFVSAGKRHEKHV